MLVLTRRSGEAVVIGNDVVVTVLDVRGDQVRLGIDAPRDVEVHREEVFLQVQRANADAVASAARMAELLRRRGGPQPRGQARPSKRTGGGEAGG